MNGDTSPQAAAEFLKDAPHLRRHVSEQRRLAERLSRLVDSPAWATLAESLPVVDPYVARKDDATALVALLEALSSSNPVSVAPLFAAMAAFLLRQRVAASAEVYDYARQLVADHLVAPGSEVALWLQRFEDDLPLVPLEVLNRKQWIARLTRYPRAMPYARRWIATSDDARQICDALERLVDRRIAKGDLAEVELGCLPGVLARTASLVKSRTDFTLLCDGLPTLLDWLCADVGIEGTTDLQAGVLARVEQRARESASLEALLALHRGLGELPQRGEGAGAPFAASPEFRRFLESFFGDPYLAWHDGLDESALLSLRGAERVAAERVLLQALAAGRDWRAPTGLGLLRSRAGTGILKQRLGEGWERASVGEALALWRTERYAPAAACLVSILAGGASWSGRLEAAVALREVDRTEVRYALWAALDDVEPLVRHHAAASLLALSGLAEPAEPAPNPAILIMSNDEERRSRVKDLLRSMIDAKGGT